MTLWIDVTDLYHWGLGHLTGIQRTSASVLSELVKARRDVELFAYDPSKQILRKVSADSLPSVVCRYIGVVQTIPAGEVRAQSPDLPVPPRKTSDKIRRARRQLGEWLWFLKPAVRRLRSVFQRQKSRWESQEAVEVIRDFRRSTRRLLGLVWRNFAGRRRAVQAPPASIETITAGETLFRQGDVCLALSATWGFPRYGEVIAADTRASGAKCINMLYDLIPTLFPQWVLEGHSQMITLWARKQIENADAILTISQFQKREISDYIETDRLPPRNVEVVRLGDNPRLVTAIGTSLSLPRYVPERRFVICVSTLDVRKNHILLYRVWQRLVEKLGPDCPQLLLIGTPHLHVADLLHQIRYDRSVNQVIVHLRDVTDEELAWYYRNCAFTIYPSVYEGWGLPISESLSLGRYCISGDRTSLPEAGGNLVDYFDPFDFVACYNLVYRAATDPDYVKQCEDRIRESYVPYSWAMTAAHISEIVDRVAGVDGEKPTNSAPVAFS